MQRLSATTQLLYVELLQQCATALPNQRGISFVKKTVSGHRYWYMELVVGSTKRQFSLGRDSDVLRALIGKQKALYEEAAPDLKQREKLVAMLVSGGAYAPGASDGRVLEVLAQSGVFLAGGVLVGSHAFNTYGNMLGIHWDSAAMLTQDMDLASHRQIEIALRQDAPDVKSVLLESGMGFFEVPALNPKDPPPASSCAARNFTWTCSPRHRVRIPSSRFICRTFAVMRIRCGLWSTCWKTARAPRFHFAAVCLSTYPIRHVSPCTNWSSPGAARSPSRSRPGKTFNRPPNF